VAGGRATTRRRRERSWRGRRAGRGSILRVGVDGRSGRRRAALCSPARPRRTPSMEPGTTRCPPAVRSRRSRAAYGIWATRQLLLRPRATCRASSSPSSAATGTVPPDRPAPRPCGRTALAAPRRRKPMESPATRPPRPSHRKRPPAARTAWHTSERASRRPVPRGVLARRRRGDVRLLRQPAGRPRRPVRPAGHARQFGQPQRAGGGGAPSPDVIGPAGDDHARGGSSRPPRPSMTVSR
jgi:hypothetical protein